MMTAQGRTRCHGAAILYACGYEPLSFDAIRLKFVELVAIELSAVLPPDQRFVSEWQSDA